MKEPASWYYRGDNGEMIKGEGVPPMLADTEKTPMYPTPKISVPQKPKKDKTITFRANDDLHTLLNKLAKENNITLSSLMAIMAQDYIKQLENVYSKARFLNTCNSEFQEYILKYETNFPPAFRQFTIARQTYPDAARLSDADITRITDIFERESGGRVTE